MDQRQFFLRDILTVVFKHKTLIVMLPVLVFAVVFFGNYLWPKTYESMAEIRLMRGREVSQTDPTVTQASQAVTMVQMGVEDINSEMALIHSSDVLSRVVTECLNHEPASQGFGAEVTGVETVAHHLGIIDVTEDPPHYDCDKIFTPLVHDSNFPYYSGILSLPFRSARAVLFEAMYWLQLRERPSIIQAAMERLDTRIITEPLRDSHVIQVRLRLGDAKKAQYILAKLLRVYKEEHVKMFANAESESFFRDQLARVERSLSNAQLKLRFFREGIAFEERSTVDDDGNTVVEVVPLGGAEVTAGESGINRLALLDLETEKELLLEQYTRTQTLLAELTRVERALTTENIDSSLLATLSSETQSTVVREMQLRLLELVLERSRVVQSLGPKHPTVQSLENQISNAQTDLIELIANTKGIATSQQAEIVTRLELVNRTKSELDRLEQDVQITTDSYEYYAGKVEESVVADELARRSVSNVQIFSKPSMPVDPVRPNKLLNLAVALIGGLIAALAIAFFLDYLDHGLKTPEDVEHYLKLAPLASFFNGPRQPLDARQAERLSVLLESASTEGSSHILQVVSSVPNEGATQVATALANAYGNDSNSRTLFVDFTGEISGSKNSRYGMTDVLLDQADSEEVFASEGNLTLVGRGSHADYPTYLWGSERMKQLVNDLRGKYQHVIFHVGPVLQSQDALILARHVDGIVITIKADATRREVVARALEMFKDSKARVLGAVLTERTQTIPQSVYRHI